MYVIFDRFEPLILDNDVWGSDTILSDDGVVSVDSEHNHECDHDHDCDCDIDHEDSDPHSHDDHTHGGKAHDHIHLYPTLEPDFGTAAALPSDDGGQSYVTASVNPIVYMDADIAGDTTTTASVQVNGAVSSRNEQAGDTDWFSVQLTAGVEYTIFMIRSGDDAHTDPLLRLLNSSGDEVAENDDIFNDTDGDGILDEDEERSTQNSAITFTPDASGTYYISAQGWNNTEFGDYTIYVNQGNFRPTVDIDTQADFLANGFQNRELWNTTTITYDISALPEDQQTFALAAMQLWADVTPLSFVQGTTGSAALTFTNDEEGAFAQTTTLGGFTTSATINISQEWVDTNGAGFNSYTYQTFIHEVGHALGLGHGGPYNGTSTFGVDNIFSNDLWQYSVMSYNDQGEGLADDNGTPRLVLGLQMADILAVQDLYGANDAGTRGGATVYGFNSNAGGMFDFGRFQNDFLALRPDAEGPIRPPSLAIYDTGGIDRLDLSGYASNQRISLIEETFSDIGDNFNTLATDDPLINLISIARGTVIENATGGSGDDTITGNAVNNVLIGGAGNDTIYANEGEDTVSAEAGNDTVFGGIGADILNGGAGDDTINGDAGGDTLFGSVGNDVVNGGDGFDLIFGGDGNDQVNGDGGNDNVFGGNGDDVVSGGAGRDNVYGDAGDDTLFGGLDNDILAGQAGNDTINGDEGTDSIFAGDGDDIVNGGDDRDFIFGEAGNDTINGGDDGDAITAGTGNDILNGDAGNDAISGQDGDDILNGGTGDDALAGGLGNDVINGGDGADSISGGDGADVITGGTGSDGVFGLAGNDTINGGDDQDFLYGNSGDDTLSGDGGNDSLFGGFGNDALFGGDGADTLAGEDGIDVITGGAGNDSISGGLGDDTINGDAGRDSIFAGDGADTINGGADVDFIFGGAGNDTINGGLGNDQLRGEAGSDVFVFQASNGNDIVHDFVQGEDTLSIQVGSAYDSFAEIMAATTQSGSNVLINLTGGNFITIVSLDKDSLTAADFSFTSTGQKDVEDVPLSNLSSDQFVFNADDVTMSYENDTNFDVKSETAFISEEISALDSYTEAAFLSEVMEDISLIDQIDFAL